MSNLSCLSDTEGSKSGGGARNKKTRSSVSSRSREGGSLPPTKFENVMLYEPPAWDPASQASSSSPTKLLIEFKLLPILNGLLIVCLGNLLLND